MGKGYTELSLLFLFQLHLNLQLSQKQHQRKENPIIYQRLTYSHCGYLTRNHTFNLIGPRVLGLMEQLSWYLRFATLTYFRKEIHTLNLLTINTGTQQNSELYLLLYTV